jgi:hypothetical protein
MVETMSTFSEDQDSFEIKNNSQNTDIFRKVCMIRFIETDQRANKWLKMKEGKDINIDELTDIYNTVSSIRSKVLWVMVGKTIIKQSMIYGFDIIKHKNNNLDKILSYVKPENIVVDVRDDEYISLTKIATEKGESNIYITFAKNILSDMLSDSIQQITDMVSNLDSNTNIDDLLFNKSNDDIPKQDDVPKNAIISTQHTTNDNVVGYKLSPSLQGILEKQDIMPGIPSPKSSSYSSYESSSVSSVYPESSASSLNSPHRSSITSSSSSREHYDDIEMNSPEPSTSRHQSAEATYSEELSEQKIIEETTNIPSYPTPQESASLVDDNMDDMEQLDFVTHDTEEDIINKSNSFKINEWLETQDEDEDNPVEGFGLSNNMVIRDLGVSNNIDPINSFNQARDNSNVSVISDSFEFNNSRGNSMSRKRINNDMHIDLELSESKKKKKIFDIISTIDDEPVETTKTKDVMDLF